MNKEKYFVKMGNNTHWNHRTPLKVYLNPILRKLQFWTNKPYVITSWCDMPNPKSIDKPKFLKYKIGKMKYK